MCRGCPSRHRLADKAWTWTGAWCTGRLHGRGTGGSLLGRPRKRLRNFKEGEAQLENGTGQQRLLGVGKVAGGALMQNGQHVDRLARAQDIDLGLLAFLGAAAKLQNCLHVNGLHNAFEAERGRVLGTWVRCTHGNIQAVSGGLEGNAGLLHLLVRGRRGQVRLGLGFRRGNLLICERHCGNGGRSGPGVRRVFRRWHRLAMLFRGRIGVGAGFTRGGKFTAIRDDKGKRLFRHGR